MVNGLKKYIIIEYMQEHGNEAYDPFKSCVNDSIQLELQKEFDRDRELKIDFLFQKKVQTKLIQKVEINKFKKYVKYRKERHKHWYYNKTQYLEKRMRMRIF